ncbi:unnamed protein product [Lota lota]
MVHHLTVFTSAPGNFEQAVTKHGGLKPTSSASCISSSHQRASLMHSPVKMNKFSVFPRTHLLFDRFM